MSTQEAAAQPEPEALTPQEYRRRYGAALRAERDLANMTQPEFAEYVGVSVSALQKWELGVKLPRPVIRRRLAALYPRLARLDLTEGGADG